MTGKRPNHWVGLLHLTLRQARKLVVGVIGGTIVLIGIVMIVTPGPAIVVIPLGVAILASEFVWARWLLTHVRGHVERYTNRNRPPADTETRADATGSSGVPSTGPTDNAE
jgi:uncharacterized protein (TIGR02611 family)